MPNFYKLINDHKDRDIHGIIPLPTPLIFNSSKIELEDYTPEIKKPIIEKQIEEIDDEDDDWSSVPAFLRRKK